MLWAPTPTPQLNQTQSLWGCLQDTLQQNSRPVISDTQPQRQVPKTHAQEEKTHYLNLQLTFSGSWDSTSFFSLLSKKGLNTLCRRLIIKIVSSSFRSTYKTTLVQFVKDVPHRETLLHSCVSMHTEIPHAIKPGECQPTTPPNFLPTCLPHWNKMTAK